MEFKILTEENCNQFDNLFKKILIQYQDKTWLLGENHGIRYMDKQLNAHKYNWDNYINVFILP